jgi:hypothetical protein
MADTFRALCARMADELDHYRQLLMDDRRATHALATEARAALAQPEPQGPTDEEIYKLALDGDFLVDVGDGFSCMVQDEVEFARAVLARWGRPAIEPVPVSERWPEFSDCNPFEAVWAFNPVLDHWKLTRINQSIHTHWLPCWALPVPAPANTINQNNY